MRMILSNRSSNPAMGLTNYHIHSDFCDGHASMEEFVRKAIELDMSAIAFSSHSPVPYKTDWNLPAERLDEYVSTIKILKKKYRGTIDIYSSLEVDYLAGIQGPGDEKFKNLDLDFVMGSIHFLGNFSNGMPWTIDCPVPEFLKGFREIYSGDAGYLVHTYFETTRQMVKNSTPDVLAHMDRIKMHNIVEPIFDESESWYRDELRHTLEVIKEKGVIVEINTKAVLRNGMIYPGREYFKWIKELDIPIVMNSDAHRPEYLTAGFKEVAEMLKEDGIEYKLEFVEGKWKQIKI